VEETLYLLTVWVQFTASSTELVASCAPNQVDLIAFRNACAVSLSLCIICIIRELLVEQELDQLVKVRLSLSCQCLEPVC
jgi:hypothetical protein